MAPCDLASLLAPLDVQDFLRTCWGKDFRHVRGTPGRFTPLLPWAALNRILEQHRLESPRLRLTREGKPVPPATYSSFHTNRKRPGQTIPRLHGAGLTRELRDGATLVLDAVDELSPPITQLAESLEPIFRVRVQVNAYAGWRTSHGFNLHWDDHDVFILQLAGRKHWKIYGTTRKYPLGKDAAPSKDAPQTPVWEAMLEDGDLLYIPRGWWHVATPLDEPTLHLTVGINNPTAADMLGWFAERLKAREIVRRDLPQFASPEEQRAFLDQLWQSVVSAWTPDLMREYIADLDRKAHPRPHLNLPFGATPEALPPDGETFQVKWNSSRPLVLERDGDEVRLEAQGRRWRFANAARPLLETLAAGKSIASTDVNTGLDSGTLRAFLRELALSGLVIVV